MSQHLVGIRTDIVEVIVRVRGGYERHTLSIQYGLWSKKGWRKMGPRRRGIERVNGRRPYHWKSQARQTWR